MEKLFSSGGRSAKYKVKKPWRIVGVFWLMFFLSCSVSANAQYNDWKSFALKGRVRTMTTSGYDSAWYEKGRWTPLKEEPYVVRRYFFNPDGMLDSLLLTTFGPPKTFSFKTVYHHSNGQTTGFCQAGDFDDEPTEFTIIWLDSLSYKMVYENEYGHSSESIEYFSPEYHCIRAVYKSFLGDSLTSHIETEQTYENGQLSSSLEDNKTAGTMDMIHYEQVKFDRRKNPVVTVLRNADGTFSMLYLRTIEYYDQ